ncbi:MAG: hypothetical protein IJB78_04545 [Oscillospiraceae bacterium]|nr:hypothetical protein [Oscillospiraceae bacterium]
MKKGWLIIGVIVLIAVLVGTVCIGVGLVTGADMARIFSVLDSRYHLDLYVQYFNDLAAAFKSVFVF